MVKKIGLFTIFFILILLAAVFSRPSQADSFKEILYSSPEENIGEEIASKGGWKLIEFWHSSAGYWKATTDTRHGLKEIVIKDSEAKDGIWARPEFLMEKIYENDFVLEYKIWHPEEVLDAIAAGATITPVLRIDTEVLHNPELIIMPTELFNFEPLPSGLSSDLPEKPEYSLYDGHMEIRALPKLNCHRGSLKDEINFYPHRIPLPKPSFGSLSYAMYHHEGGLAGVAYPPDPFYGDIHTLPYHGIADINEKRYVDGRRSSGCYQGGQPGR